MSITPAGGWNVPREHQIVNDTTKPLPSVVFGNTEVKRASEFSTGFGVRLGVICALVFSTAVLAILVKIPKGLPIPSEFAEIVLAAPSKPATVPIIYSVAKINDRRNHIPTGTNLAVRGIYVSPDVSGGWAPSTVLGEDGWVVPTKLDPCSTLLYGGTVRVQHGEVDPRDYCQFSVILQDENTSQIQYLKCVMSPGKARAAMHKYAYGDRVQAHGQYASSLDFHIMPTFNGDQVGVPVLEDCALEALPAPPAPQESQASPTLDQIMRAMNEVDSSPENKSKPFPVDGDLERDVRLALSNSKVLKSAVITPVSLHREVTLSGTVVDEPSRKLAEQIISQVPGVVAVHNNLTLAQSSSHNPRVTEGQTPEDVQAILGSPISISAGAKHIYLYSHLKVVFVDGKVAEIQPIDNGGSVSDTAAATKDVPLLNHVPMPRTDSSFSGQQYQVGGSISAPVPTFEPEAEFSDEARRAKYQGVCLVALIVDAHGIPQNVRILRGLGRGLDEKAVEAVRKYRFKPAMLDGRTPVPVPVNVTVNFRLY